MNTEFYTYLYCDPITNEPFYVGKGKGPRAWMLHTHNKTLVGHIRNLYGAHVIRAMTGLTEKRALFAEQILIWLFGRKNLNTGSLLNFTDGGEGQSGRVMSLETREKISATKKRNPKCAEHCAMMRAIRLSHPKGPMRTETRAKISATKRGHVVAAETRARLSAAAKAQWARQKGHISSPSINNQSPISHEV